MRGDTPNAIAEDATTSNAAPSPQKNPRLKSLISYILFPYVVAKNLDLVWLHHFKLKCNPSASVGQNNLVSLKNTHAVMDMPTAR